MTHRAIPVQCKGHGHKGLTVEKRLRKGPQCNN
jgi:hypothetical protein